MIYTVKIMIGAFSGIKKLNYIPEIPSSVTYLTGTFEGCTNLTTAPTIPSSVTNMYGTFYGCYNLSGILTINANPNEYLGCLTETVTNSTLVLNGTSSKLDKILATKGSDSNITIEQ